MNLFRLKKKSEVDFFTERLKNVKVFDKAKIEKNYHVRLPKLLDKLTNLLSEFSSVKFLIVFDMKLRKRSWYSELSGRVIINSTFDLTTPEFKEEFQKAIKEYQEIEPFLD